MQLAMMDVVFLETANQKCNWKA